MVIILIIVAILAIGIIYINNTLSQLRNSAQDEFKSIDTLLKIRWEILPDLVETVKKYASFEQETLESIIRTRAKTYSKLNINEKIEISEKMSECITKLISLETIYPKLRENPIFVNVVKKVKETNEALKVKVKKYNNYVKIYNNKIKEFPNKIFAEKFNFTEMKLFTEFIKNNEIENS